MNDETLGVLYVLIVEAIYDHGVVGIFTTEQQARDVAEKVWRQSDGHHRFRIEPMRLDVTYDAVLVTKPHYGFSPVVGDDKPVQLDVREPREVEDY